MNHQIVIDFPDELFSALRSKPEDFVKEILDALINTNFRIDEKLIGTILFLAKENH